MFKAVSEWRDTLICHTLYVRVPYEVDKTYFGFISWGQNTKISLRVYDNILYLVYGCYIVSSLHETFDFIYDVQGIFHVTIAKFDQSVSKTVTLTYVIQ